MKNLFVIGLFCMTLILSACGSSVGGGYSGRLDITGALFAQGSDVLAVVGKEGGTQTIDFKESAIIKNCKLRIYTIKEKGSSGGQKCEITAGGETQTLKVDQAEYFDSSNAGLKAVNIIFTGSTPGGKTVKVNYEGFQLNK